MQLFLFKNGVNIDNITKLKEIINQTVDYPGEEMRKLEAHFINHLNVISTLIPIPEDYIDPDPLTPPPAPPKITVPAAMSMLPLLNDIDIEADKEISGEMNWDDLFHS